MKTCCLPLVAAALALLLMVSTVQSIRLDAETHAAISTHLLTKSVDQKGATMINKTDDGSPSGGVEETISEEKDRAAGHRMPEIHVDYYGPRGHNPRHH